MLRGLNVQHSTLINSVKSNSTCTKVSIMKIEILISKSNTSVCAKCQQKLSTAKIKRHRFLLMKWGGHSQ
jgi:hypothetical protein